MFDIAFQQSIFLAVVDKVLEAVIIVGVGLWANRALERFRANEAIRTKAAEIRVKEISDIWAELENIDIETWKVALASIETIKEEQKGWTPEQVRAHVLEQSLPESTVARLKVEYESTINDLVRRTKGLQSQVVFKSFWLGKAARIACTRHINSLNNYLNLIRDNLFSGHQNDFLGQKSMHAGFGVMNSKEDITDLLRTL
jgi:hypothetical protein